MTMAPSRESGIKTMYAALRILKENNGEMRHSDIIKEIEKTVELTDWEKEIPPTSKYNTPRWKIFFDAVSPNYRIVGYIIKKSGVWYLTEEGEKALQRKPEDIFKEAKSAYRKHLKAYHLSQNNDGKEDFSENAEEQDIYSIENLIEHANNQIREYIQNISPYDFQDMVAALLRAMGYYTPFIAPKGKDGGIDIVAYQDSLGTKPPRIKVQVKHYKKDSNISVDVVRSIIGLLKPGIDVGIIVTTSDFTADAQAEARQSEKSIRLINGEEFIQLWLQYYEKMITDDKNRMPLFPVYMLNLKKE